MEAEIVPELPELFYAYWPFVIMLGVFLQLLLYAAVVLNRYTAIVHPMRHDKVWAQLDRCAIHRTTL